MIIVFLSPIPAHSVKYSVQIEAHGVYVNLDEKLAHKGELECDYPQKMQWPPLRFVPVTAW